MRVRIDADCELHCEVHGDERGSPVLFVHGFPLSAALWRPTVQRLDPARFRCIVPDLRGHGRSPPTDDVSMPLFADDMAALLDALGESRPVAAVGLSMGGIIAQEFFHRHRSRAAALVLADTRSNAETPEGRVRREEAARTALRAGAGAVADGMIDRLFAPAASSALRERWRRIMSETPAAGVAAAARALGARDDLTPLLARIDVPTLIVVGEHDAITPVNLMHDMHCAIPRSRFVALPDAGHLPPVEQPDVFADVLRAFLATVR